MDTTNDNISSNDIGMIDCTVIAIIDTWLIRIMIDSSVTINWTWLVAGVAPSHELLVNLWMVKEVLSHDPFAPALVELVVQLTNTLLVLGLVIIVLRLNSRLGLPEPSKLKCKLWISSPNNLTISSYLTRLCWV